MAGAATSELISAMRELSPDVVFIQECDARCEALISAPDIRAQWPHRIVQSGASVEGSAILSVFELSESADVNGEFAMPAAVIQDSRLPQISVQLAHPFPPLPTTTHVWKNELNAFAGDFNAGFEHAVFRELVTAGKFASAASASSTQAPTWRIGGIEFLGTTLDHILLRGMESREFTIVELPSSDHKAIYAQLVF
jgi:endonuclease/exonuclease/phosphatase (EEP) superfamily protein YafD